MIRLLDNCLLEELTKLEKILKISPAHSLKVRKIMGMSRKSLELIMASNLNKKLVCQKGTAPKLLSGKQEIKIAQCSRKHYF